MAVWASGQYGGVSLGEWRRRLPRPAPPVADLLGGRFRRMPEAGTYPFAGLFVEAAVGRVGLDAFRDRLYGATSSTWEEACRDAGTTPQELEAAFHAALVGEGQPGSGADRREDD